MVVWGHVDVVIPSVDSKEEVHVGDICVSE